MTTNKDLTAFVLLAHLVALSAGHMEGLDEFEKILSKNVSIVLIENKASNETVDEALGTMTSLTRGYNNFSTTPGMKTTMTTSVLQDEEKVLGDEIKEVLETAASMGQVIMISIPKTESANSTKSLLADAILIEDPVDNNKNLENNSSLDQEIARSEINPRFERTEHEGDDNVETLRNLLAIADYEPQKIHPKKIEQISTQPSRDQTTYQVQSTSRPLLEDTHYDVPKQINSPGDSQRIIENGIPTITMTIANDSSTQLPLAPKSSNPHEFQHVQRTSRLDKSEDVHTIAKRKKPSLHSKLHKKASNNYAGSSREPRHLGSLATLMPNPSTPLPRTLPEVQEQSRKREKFSYPSELSRKNLFESSKVSSPSTISRLVSPVESIPQKQTLPDQDKNYGAIATNLAVSQAANRRVDDYSLPGYANSVKHENLPLTSPHQQLGFLTRYNLPSLLVGRRTKTHSHPPVILTYRKQPESAEQLREEEEERDDREENSSEEASAKNTGSYVQAEDSDESSEERSQNNEQSSKQSVSEEDYSAEDASGEKHAALYGSYENEEEPEQDAPTHDREKYSPLASTTPVYESYENDEELEQDTRTYDREKNSPLASTTPVYESYAVYEKPERPKPASYRYNLNSPVEKRPSVKNLYGSVPPKPFYHPYDTRGRIPASAVTPINNLLLNTPTYTYYSTHPSPTNSGNKPYNSQKNSPITRNTKAIDENGSGSYEESEETKSPSGAINKIPYGNYVVHNYNGHQNLVTTPFPWIRKDNDDNSYREKNSNDHSLPSSYKFSPLSTARTSTVNNPQRSTKSSARLSSPAYEERPDADGNDTEGKIHASSARQYPVIPSRDDEENNPASGSSLITPEYESSEYNDRASVSPLTKGTSGRSQYPTYGNRVKPLSVQKYDDNSLPRYRAPGIQTFSHKLPVRRKENGRVVPPGIEEKPVESVHRADLRKPTLHEDEEPASSGHEENHDDLETHAQSKKDDGGGGGGGGGKEKSEKGSGEKHEEGHYGSHDEKGEKGYKHWHEYDKGKKGHRDEENHEHEYDEKKGQKKKHEDESGYHKEHHHAEKGDKESEFGEKGEHQKGHSTKGQHVVHKKDEYEKKTEFYDESHEEDGHDKEDEYHHEHESKKGGHEKIGHHDSGHHEEKYGEKGEHEKGRHYDETKGHEDAYGREQDHRHEEKYGKKGGHEEGSKWSHKKGDNRKR